MRDPDNLSQLNLIQIKASGFPERKPTGEIMWRGT
jgi:hypothetical protein